MSHVLNLIDRLQLLNSSALTRLPLVAGSPGEVPVRGSETLVDCAGQEVLKRMKDGFRAADAAPVSGPAGVRSDALGMWLDGWNAELESCRFVS